MVYSNVYEMSPSRRERSSRNTNNGNDRTVEFSLIGWARTVSHPFITGMFRMRYQNGPTRGALLHGQQYGINLDDWAIMHYGSIGFWFWPSHIFFASNVCWHVLCQPCQGARAKHGYDTKTEAHWSTDAYWRLQPTKIGNKESHGQPQAKGKGGLKKKDIFTERELESR
jgi:hypothetical protein